MKLKINGNMIEKDFIKIIFYFFRFLWHMWIASAHFKDCFKCVQMGDPYSKLYLVCKKFRKVVYLSRTEMIIHISALTNECGMKLKPDLEKVTLSGLCGGQTTSDVQPFINLFDLKFQNNENLVLKGFCLGENFFFNYWILCHMQSCWFWNLCFVITELYVGELKCVLEKIPTLKFCDVECNLETVLDYHVFAEIAN